MPKNHFCPFLQKPQTCEVIFLQALLAIRLAIYWTILICTKTYCWSYLIVLQVCTWRWRGWHNPAEGLPPLWTLSHQITCPHHGHKTSWMSHILFIYINTFIATTLTYSHQCPMLAVMVLLLSSLLVLGLEIIMWYNEFFANNFCPKKKKE